MFTNFWYEIYESLKRKPTRAILTGIGIAWGIFILILLVGIGSAFERGVFKIFSGFSKSMTYVYASETSLGYKESQAGRRIAFTEEDLRMLKAGIPEITHITPEVSRWNIVYADEKNGRFEIKGVYPDYFDIKRLEVDDGRILNVLDMRESRKVVLIGENVAEVLFKDKLATSRQIRINQEIYRVTGTIKNTILNTYEARSIYMPYSTYMQSNADAGKFSTMVYALKDKADVSEANHRIRSLMARKYRFDPKDDNTFYFNSMEEQVKAFTSLFSMLKNFLWFMGISTLVSGVIGVGNIMYAAAKERTREVGIRKSVGASAGMIKAMFLWEAVALTSIAGYIGIAAGWSVLKIIGLFISEDTVMMEKPGVDLPTTIAAVFILMISGILAGLKPAIYAAELNPVEALKEEI